jgi:hypothetical protein
MRPNTVKLKLQQTKQKYKLNHQQTGLPPHSALPINEKQTKTQHRSHPIRSLHKPLDQPQRVETGRKKKFNLEALEKETSNTINLKKNNNEKAEKYYTNEGTN